MKVIPASAPAPQTVTTTNTTTATQRAIAAFNKGAPTQGQAQETPVADPNNVSAEELSAIRAPSVPNNTEVEAQSEETPKAAPEAEEVQEDPALTRQLAHLARQERALRAKAQQTEQALKAREAALAAREAELSAKDDQYKQGYVSKDRLKQDVLSVLAEAGLSYDDVTQQVINQQPRNPQVDRELSELKAEIQRLNKANEDGQKQSQARQDEQYQAAIQQITRDTQDLVKNDPDTYEAVAKTNSIRDVVELIERTFKEEGRVMSVEDAAQEVENYLVEEGVSTLSRIQKIKRKLMASAQTPETNAKTQATNKQTQLGTMKTLTNAASSSRQLSAKERAILAFKGELKS